MTKAKTKEPDVKSVKKVTKTVAVRVAKPVVQAQVNEESLQKMGLHAQYQHNRYIDGSAITVCAIEDDQYDVIAVGYAICSHKDNFCRATGRDKSFKNAMIAIKEMRNAVPLKNHGINYSNIALFLFSVGHKHMAQFGCACK